MGLLLGPFHFLGEDNITLWQAFYSIATSTLVLFLAPVAGTVLGLRSALTGNRSGVVATVVAVAILAILLVWSIAGGWFDTTPAVT